MAPYSRLEEQKYRRHRAKDPTNNPEGHRRRKAADAAHRAEQRRLRDHMAQPTDAQRRVARLVEAQERLPPNTLQYIYAPLGGPFCHDTLHYTDGTHVYAARCECNACRHRGQGAVHCRQRLDVQMDQYFLLRDEWRDCIAQHQGAHKRLHFAHWLCQHAYFD